MQDRVATPIAKRITNPATPSLYPQTSHIYASTLPVRCKESKSNTVVKKPKSLDIYYEKSLQEHSEWIKKAELSIGLNQNYFDSEAEEID